MTKETDTSAEDVKRLRKLLSYGLPPHVGVQTGEGTSSPNAVFADADYEIGDGVCGIHSSGKQANEPCIPYIRADALIHSLAERDEMKSSCEFWERCAVKNEKRWKKAEAERDTYKARAEMAEKALDWASAVVHQVANCEEVEPNTLAVALLEIDNLFAQTDADPAEPITRDDARDLALVDEPGPILADAYCAGRDAAAKAPGAYIKTNAGKYERYVAQRAIRALEVPDDFGGG